MKIAEHELHEWTRMFQREGVKAGSANGLRNTIRENGEPERSGCAVLESGSGALKVAGSRKQVWPEWLSGTRKLHWDASASRLSHFGLRQRTSTTAGVKAWGAFCHGWKMNG
jgi:hypothetical protein